MTAGCRQRSRQRGGRVERIVARSQRRVCRLFDDVHPWSESSESCPLAPTKVLNKGGDLKRKSASLGLFSHSCVLPHRSARQHTLDSKTEHFAYANDSLGRRGPRQPLSWRARQVRAMLVASVRLVDVGSESYCGGGHDK